MNDNPWNVDNMARMQRERIQEAMREIRLQESARRIFPQQPSLLMRILVKLLLPIQRLLNPPAQRHQPAVQPALRTSRTEQQSHT